MFFLIETVERVGADAQGKAERQTRHTWTLHRKDKDAEDYIGAAVCRAVETWATEKQTRAAINTAKRAMQGVRFAQTRVKGAKP